jgi:hypothetical protein
VQSPPAFRHATQHCFGFTGGQGGGAGAHQELTGTYVENELQVLVPVWQAETPPE